MIKSTEDPTFAGIIPLPQQIQLLDETTELSSDVRLITRNVLPLQRKAMRGVLSSAGVRVVANKKTYIIETYVEKEEDFDYPSSPGINRDEYYELELRDKKIYIRTTSQAGALWASQTLAEIYRSVPLGEPIPAAIIRDWPDVPNRGIFFDSKWGPEGMDFSDWNGVIDRTSGMKMNRLVVELYGCCPARMYEGKYAESLMVPVPGYDDIPSERSFKWFSPAKNEWRDEPTVPFMFQENDFSDVVSYGKEKCVEVIPLVNSLGHNTLIPRYIPELSAKSEDGTPRGTGYCLSNPELKEFIENFYESIIEEHFPEGIAFFHIGLSGPCDPSPQGEFWCECDQCRSADRKALVCDYVTWLVKMLTRKGVDKVLVRSELLTGGMNLLDPLMQQLEDNDLGGRLVIHWQCPEGDPPGELVRMASTETPGITVWAGTTSNTIDLSKRQQTFENLTAVLDAICGNAGEGVLSASVQDSAEDDQETFTASHCWNHGGVSGWEEESLRWAKSRLGDKAADFTEASRSLASAWESFPALSHCSLLVRAANEPESESAPDFPSDALDRINENAADDSLSKLTEASEAARKAGEGFQAILEKTNFNRDLKDCIRSYLAESVRVRGLADVFGFLVKARKAAVENPPNEKLKAECTAAKEDFLEALAEFESAKPGWMLPSAMHGLSKILNFLDQLIDDLENGDATEIQCSLE